MKKRKMIVPALALGVATVVGVAGISHVSANEGDQYPPIIEKIAEKFNLNQDEVKQVFDEERESHQEEMKAKREERLNQLVSDGKLTEDQKNALTAKEEEMQKERETQMEAVKDLSPEERREKMEEYREAHKDEMKDFFEEQRIDASLFAPLGGQGEGMKRGGGFGPGKMGQ